MIKVPGAGRAGLMTLFLASLIATGFAQDSSNPDLERLPTAADWPIKHLDQPGSGGVELRFSYPGATGPWTSTIADVNGDGIDDLVIGLPWASPLGNRAAGLVYVLFGSKEGFDGPLDLDRLAPGQGMRIAGQNSGDHLGWSLAAAGDFNGNGADDLMIGAPGAGPGGRVYVIFGAAQGHRLPNYLNPAHLNGSNGLVIEGDPDSGNLGQAVAGLGDFSGNGFADLALSSPGASPDGLDSAGRVHVMFGGDHSFKARLRTSELVGATGLTINGDRDGQRLGRTLSGIGDFNANGFADLAFNATDGDMGELLLVWGGSDFIETPISISRLAPDQHLAYRSPQDGDGFGHSLAAMGDLDRDGHTDLLISAPFGSHSGLIQSGAVYLLYGGQAPAAVVENEKVPHMTPVLFGTTNGEQLGAQITSAGSLSKHDTGNGLISARDSISGIRQVNLFLDGRRTGHEFRQLQHSTTANDQSLPGPVPSGHRLLFNRAMQTGQSNADTARSWQTASIGNLAGPAGSTLVSGPVVEPGETTPPLNIQGVFITFSAIDDQIALLGDELNILFNVFEEPVFSPEDIQVSASILGPQEPISDNDLDLTDQGSGEYDLLVLVPPGATAGVSTVQLDAFNDLSGGSGSTTFDIYVYAPQPPVLNSGEPLPDTSVNAGDTLILDFPVQDPQFVAEDLSVAASALPLPAIDSIDVLGTGATRTLSVTTVPDETGTTTVTLTAENPIGFTDTLSFDLTVVLPPEDPDITPIDDQVGVLGETISVFFQVSKVGVNPDNLVVFADPDENSQILVPDDLFLDYLGNGNYRLDIVIPENTDTGMTFIYVEVIDTVDFTSDFVTFDLIVYAPLAPILNDAEPIPDQTVTAGHLLVIDFIVDDPQFDAADIQIQASHTGQVQFDFLNVAGTAGSRQLVLQPNVNSSGSSTIVLTAVNPIDESTNLSFQVNVEPANLAPLINGGEGIADQTVMAGQLLEIPFEVSDPSENPLFLEVTAISLTPDLLPDETLVLSGERDLRMLSIQTQPQITGIAQVQVEVTNTQNWSSSTTFNVTIQSDRAPVLNDGDGIEDREVNAGDRVIIDFSVRDPVNPGDDLEVTVTSRDPDLIGDDDLTLVDEGDGNWRLEVDVPNDTSGPVEIEIRVVNSDGDETEVVFVIDVAEAPPQPPLINGGEGIDDKDVMAGESLAVEFTVSDMQFDPDQILVEASSLSPDTLGDEALSLEMGEPGIWTLFITTSEGHPGDAQIVVTATNSLMLSSAEMFTVNILESPPPEPPRINAGDGIADREVTAGENLIIEFAVSDALDDTGVIEVSATSLDPEILPDSALSLSDENGLWTLSVQAPADSVGPATVVVTATNSRGLSTEASFIVEIVAPPLEPTTLAVTATRLEVPTPLGAMFHIEITNAGQAQADNVVIAVSAPDDQQILGGFRVASACQIDGQSVFCDRQLAHPVECEMQADFLLCSTSMLAAGVTVPVAVQFNDAATIRFDVLVDADNADPVELSVEDES
jgi:hypothetical protein